MLNIHVAFEGSWTNAFADSDADPLFTSGSGFSELNKGVQSTSLPSDVAPNTMRVEALRALNRLNPEMGYRVPASYDNTVKGVMARLLGEVRRLRDLEHDHLVNRLMPGLSYAIEVTAEHDEIVSLATPPNEIRSSGAGLLGANNPLYQTSDLTRHLFGHLGLPLGTLLQEGLQAKGDWTPVSPSELILRLNALEDAQNELVKLLKSQTKQEPTFVQEFAQRVAQAMREARRPVEIDLSKASNWHIAGALIAAKLHLLNPEVKANLIANGALTKNGYIKGIAMTGGLGRPTEKDLYDGAGCNKAYSIRMPYAAEFWFEPPGHDTDVKGALKKMKFSLGVIKKSGALKIRLDLEPDLLAEVRQRLNDAAVGVFHFGKKGIAYIDRTYED